MSPDILNFFANLIERETGIVFRDSNLYQLRSRLEDIVLLEKLTSVEELHHILSKSFNSTLKQKVLDYATNNETLFFRDPTFFLGVEQFILKEVLPKFPTEIKIWSAAASTGQEAISVAITLDELSKRTYLPPFSITATDISDRALEKGKKGIYSDFELMRGMSEERKMAYFNKHPQGWQIKSQIHSKIQFGYNNLLRSTVSGPFHIILCRNVLIYQTVDCKKGVVQSLFHQLHPNGGLLLGVGETLLGIMDDVSPTMVGNVAFYRPKKINEIKIA